MPYSLYGQLDAEGTETVGDLKIKIHEAQGHAIESQKLIFSGEDLAITSRRIPVFSMLSCRQSFGRRQDRGVMSDQRKGLLGPHGIEGA